MGLSVDHAQRLPVRVHFRTSSADGHLPVDYLPVSDGLVTILPGALGASADVELVPRPPLVGELFVLELFAPEGATLAEVRTTVTITDR